VLSFASVHKFALRRYVPPCYHSHLFINALHEGARPSVLSFASVHNLRYEGGRYVPPCYHSHLFINLRYTRGRPSVLSFASVHNCVTRVALRPSVLSFASVHKFALRRGTSLRAIIRICSQICVTRWLRPSVLSFASVHGALHEGRFLRYHHSSVVNLRYEEAYVPPCYHSSVHNLRYTKGGTSLRAIIRICS
jgi:hypothetical protein